MLHSAQIQVKLKVPLFSVFLLIATSTGCLTVTVQNDACAGDASHSSAEGVKFLLFLIWKSEVKSTYEHEL